MAPLKKNTGKAPSVQFYYKDFLADMQEHPPEIIGAWMLVLIKIWHAKSNGEITYDITQLARVMNTTVGQAQEYVAYFNAESIADVTEANGKITIVNRRAKRDAKLLEQNRLRQQAYRESHESNADVTDEKRNPSSSTSTSSSTPSSPIEIDKEESSLNSGGLGLNKEVKIRAVRFGEELDNIFPRISRDEATTFLRVAQHLTEEVILGTPIEIFDEAIGWAKSSMAGNARNPKGLFIAKVKEQTDFTGRGKLLNRVAGQE